MAGGDPTVYVGRDGVNTAGPDQVLGQERRWDIDWLRISAVLLLFAFHTARIFDNSGEFYVKNSQLGDGASYLVAYLSPWGMPLFFVLAGASTFYALRVRSAGRYGRERATRLLIPFIFGLLVLIPPQSYIGLRSHSDYAGAFLEWYPRFFQLIPEDMEGYFLGGHTWGHLWFILHLFLYTAAALPLFLYLRRESGQRMTRKLASFFSHRGMILLLGIPLVFAAQFPEIVGGNPLRYIIIFVYGYVLASDARFEEAIDTHKLAALFLGPVVQLVVAYFDATGRPSGIPAWSEPIVDRYIVALHPLVLSHSPPGLREAVSELPQQSPELSRSSLVSFLHSPSDRHRHHCLLRSRVARRHPSQVLVDSGGIAGSDGPYLRPADQASQRYALPVRHEGEEEAARVIRTAREGAACIARGESGERLP
jgi:hypothetical protein